MVLTPVRLRCVFGIAGVLALGCANAPQPTYARTFTDQDIRIGQYLQQFRTSEPSLLSSLTESDSRLFARTVPKLTPEELANPDSFSGSRAVWISRPYLDPFEFQRRGEAIQSASDQYAELELPDEYRFGAQAAALQPTLRALAMDEEIFARTIEAEKARLAREQQMPRGGVTLVRALLEAWPLRPAPEEQHMDGWVQNRLESIRAGVTGRQGVLSDAERDEMRIDLARLVVKMGRTPKARAEAARLDEALAKALTVPYAVDEEPLSPSAYKVTTGPPPAPPPPPPSSGPAPSILDIRPPTGTTQADVDVVITGCHFETTSTLTTLDSALKPTLQKTVSSTLGGPDPRCNGDKVWTLRGTIQGRTLGMAADDYRIRITNTSDGSYDDVLSFAITDPANKSAFEQGAQIFVSASVKVDTLEPSFDKARDTLRGQIDAAMSVLDAAHRERVLAEAKRMLLSPAPCLPHMPVRRPRDMAPPEERALACSLVRTLEATKTDEAEVSALIALHDAATVGDWAVEMHGAIRNPARVAERRPLLVKLTTDERTRVLRDASVRPYGWVAAGLAATVLLEHGASAAKRRASTWRGFGEAPIDIIDAVLTDRR